MHLLEITAAGFLRHVEIDYNSAVEVLTI